MTISVTISEAKDLASVVIASEEPLTNDTLASIFISIANDLTSRGNDESGRERIAGSGEDVDVLSAIADANEIGTDDCE